MFLQHLVDQIRQQYNTAQRNPVVQQLEMALRQNSAQGHPGFSGNMIHQPQMQQPYQQPRMWEDGSGMNMGQMPHMQMQQDAGGYGAPIQGGYSPMNPQQGYSPLSVMPQGGQFNPGLTLMQDNYPVRYNQAPQHPYSIY